MAITYTEIQRQRLYRDPLAPLDAEHDAFVELLSSPHSQGQDLDRSVHSRSHWRRLDHCEKRKREDRHVEQLAHEHGLASSYRRNGCRLTPKTFCESDPAIEVEQAEVRHRLTIALANLSAQERSILVARYYDNQPLREIASRLGCKVQSVHRREKRALQHLQSQLTALWGH